MLPYYHNTYRPLTDVSLTMVADFVRARYVVARTDGGLLVVNSIIVEGGEKSVKM